MTGVRERSALEARHGPRRLTANSVAHCGVGDALFVNISHLLTAMHHRADQLGVVVLQRLEMLLAQNDPTQRPKVRKAHLSRSLSSRKGTGVYLVMHLAWFQSYDTCVCWHVWWNDSIAAATRHLTVELHVARRMLPNRCGGLHAAE